VTVDEHGLLIVGASGQLASALRARYPQARVAGSRDVDISDAGAVAAFDWAGVETILNAAAYTDVDGAEANEGRVSAWQVNAIGAANLAGVAAQRELTLVHVSTDYVFDGTRAPHREDEPLSPLGVYGQSKAAGDVAVALAPQHYVVRTSWVTGSGLNFVRTMLGLGRKGVSPTVVADQTGRLTFTHELVRAIDHLLGTRSPYGCYHVSNGGDVASWAEITRAIFELAGFDAHVTDTTTEQYFADKPGAAPRPLGSAFDLGKLRASGFEPGDWYKELEGFVAKELAQ
jgi:dTDP-4-dehydrorhamnose reductase